MRPYLVCPSTQVRADCLGKQGSHRTERHLAAGWKPKREGIQPRLIVQSFLIENLYDCSDMTLPITN